jgi:hypothetical protein
VGIGRRRAVDRRSRVDEHGAGADEQLGRKTVSDENEPEKETLQVCRRSVEAGWVESNFGVGLWSPGDRFTPQQTTQASLYASRLDGSARLGR